MNEMSGQEGGKAIVLTFEIGFGRVSKGPEIPCYDGPSDSKC